MGGGAGGERPPVRAELSTFNRLLPAMKASRTSEGGGEPGREPNRTGATVAGRESADIARVGVRSGGVFERGGDRDGGGRARSVWETVREWRGVGLGDAAALGGGFVLGGTKGVTAQGRSAG